MSSNNSIVISKLFCKFYLGLSSSYKEEIMSEIRAMTDIEDANIKKVKALSPSQIKVFEETCLIRNANNGRHKYEAGL